MLALIASIILIVSFLAIIFGYYLFARNWKTNSKLERGCSRFYEDLSSSGEYCIQRSRKKPLIIVETKGKYENIRTFIKKLIIRVKGGESPQIIYVFRQDTLEEKEAYLIRELISNEWNQIKVLDFTFLDTMINYFAYKFVHKKKSISDAVKHILRTKYETCALRECIAKLDDCDYEDEVVINLPPKKKPILHDIILPLVIDQNKKIDKMSFQKIETIKSELMKIIMTIYQKKCGILFIGELSIRDYSNLLRSNYYKYEYFLLSARGSKASVLDNVIDKHKTVMPRKTKFESIFEGTYLFRLKARENTNYKYILLRKVRFPRQPYKKSKYIRP